MSLRWRIALAFMALTTVAFAGLGWYFHNMVIRSMSEEIMESLLVQAALAKDLLDDVNWNDEQALTQSTIAVKERTGARVTLIDETGRVIVDTDHSAEMMDDHSNRPERLQALREGRGSSIRPSDTAGVDMLYVAILKEDNQSQGSVVRLALPLVAVHEQSVQLRTTLIVGFMVALVLVWFISMYLSSSLTDPINKLVRIAQRVSRGDLQARVRDIGNDEIGVLAGVFNDAVGTMAGLLEKIQRESHYYAAILEQMTDAVVLTDDHGRVKFINPAFARIFGVAESEAESHLLEELAPNYDLSALLSRSMESRTALRNEIRVLHPETRILACVATPLVDESGSVFGAVGLLRDLTDLYRMDEVRREFVANASHELRTPAAGIRALAEALEAGAFHDSKRGPDFVRQIVEAAERLTHILDDMLTLTRVERGRDLLRPQWLDVARVVDDAVSEVSPAVQGKNISVAVSVAAEEKIWADADSIRSVAVNLLDNAVKYTPENGTISVMGRVVPGGYELCFSDTGVGIPPEDIPRIFERFYRVDKTRDRATGGTGLGLAIVKHVVEAHGGRVSVRSMVGEGSTFTVFIPFPENSVVE